MKRRLTYAAAAIAVALLLVASPAGTWLVASLLTHAAPRFGDLHVDIESTRGWLASRPTFEQIEARDADGSWSLSAQTLSLSSWTSRLEVAAPRLRLVFEGGPDSTNQSEAEPDSIRGSQGEIDALPMRMLPELFISDGRIELSRPADSIDVLVDALDLHFRPPDRRLTLNAGSISVQQYGVELAHAELEARLRLGAREIGMESLVASARVGSVAVETIGSGSFLLAPGLPAAAQVRLQADSDDGVVGTAEIALSGDTQPANLQLTVRAIGSHPALGEITLESHSSLEGAVAAVDSARLAFADGEAIIQSRYDAGTDSFNARLEVREGFNLGEVTGVTGLGRLEGKLSVRAQPGSARYAGQVEAHLLSEAVAGNPVAFDLNAALEADGRLEAQLRSELGSLRGSGTADVGKALYDVGITGALHLDRFLGYDAAPVDLSGRAAPDTISLELHTPELPVPKGHLGPLRLRATLTQQRWLDAALELEGDLARAITAIDLQRGELDTLQLEISDMALSRLVPGLAGSLTARLDGGGELDFVGSRAHGRGQLSELSYAGWDLGIIDVQLHHDAGIARVTATGRGMSGTASVDPSMLFEGRVEFAETEFARTLQNEGAPSSIAGEATPGDQVALSGDLAWSADLHRPEELQAHMSIHQLNGRIGGDSLVARGPQIVSYGNESLTIERLSLHSPLGILTASGHVGVDSLDLSASVDSLSPGALRPQLSGTGWARLEVSGSPSRPTATAVLTADQLALHDRPLGDVRVGLQLADSLVVEASLDQSFVSEYSRALIDSAAAADTTVAGVRVRLAAPVRALLTTVDSIDGEAELRLAAERLELGAALSEALQDSVDGRLDLQGLVTFPAGHLRHGVEWDELRGLVRLSHFEIEKSGLRLHLPEAGASVLFGSSERSLDLEGFSMPVEVYSKEQGAFGPAGALGLSGGLDSADDLELVLSLVDLDLLTFVHAGVDEGSVPEGVVTAEARFTDVDGDRGLEATAAISLEEFGDVTGQLHGSATEVRAQVEWTTYVADVVSATLQMPWDLTNGTVDREAGRAEIRTEGLNLFVFLEQLPQLQDFDGLMTADVAVEGLGDNLELRGRIEAEDLRFSIPNVKPGYVFPSGQIAFDGKRGELQGFRGSPLAGKKGSIELSGFVGLDSAAIDYDVRLEAKDLPYAYDDIFEVENISGVITFKRSDPGALLEGDVRLGRALAEPPLVDLTVTPVPPPPPALQSPFLESTRLNLSVELIDLEVKNELADIELEGQAQVYGSFYKPRFQGEVRIPGGKVIALNREFSFTKGRIILDQLVPTYSILDLAYDPLLLNPELDIEAVATVRPIDEDEDREVTMSLQGPALNAAPRFASPGMGDTEVITLLAFGSTSMGDYSRDYLYEAAAAAAGQLLLSRQVQKIGFDEFQIMPSGTVLGTVGEPTLRLGKHFSVPVPVWVRYEALRREPSFGELQLEYKMTSYLTVNGAAHSEKEVYGVGVGLKKSF